MDDLSLLIDLHLEATRQGPGDATQARRAVESAGLPGRRDLRVADIGCGTGASSLVIAQDLRSQVAAVDTLPALLAALQSRAEQAGLTAAISLGAYALLRHVPGLRALLGISSPGGTDLRWRNPRYAWLDGVLRRVHGTATACGPDGYAQGDGRRKRST